MTPCSADFSGSVMQGSIQPHFKEKKKKESVVEEVLTSFCVFRPETCVPGTLNVLQISLENYS